MHQRIYFDNAATTAVDGEVVKAMEPYFSEKYGNPSSIHSFGQEAIAAIDEAREKIATRFECGFDDIIFTGSATEANNLAIFGIAKNFRPGNSKFVPDHFITTAIEHESVLEPMRELEKVGHKITFVPADKSGFVKISDIEKSIKKNTVLVSVIYANNEIGTVQPVREIGKLIEKINIKRGEARLPKIYFHTDAVQAVNYLECRPNRLKIDLLTFSGHKIYGPKGVGCLYVKKNTPLHPIIFGGGQEFGLRPGTENVSGIVGLAEAAELAFENREKRSKYVLDLRNELWKNIVKYCETAELNGSFEGRLPNNLNVRFPGVSNETLIVALDRSGIAVSAGAACSSRASKPSHTLIATGLSAKQAKESVRITLGKNTAKKEIKIAAKIIGETIKKLETKI